MKLNDARKQAIRRQTKIGFRLSGGAECWIERDGITRVPSLKSPPGFNLEEEFAGAQEFRLAEAQREGSRMVTRAELEQWCSAVAMEAEHEEEH
ncbi:MAG: hypothetical protein FJW20_13080 [Acidimicrobiia bacterium]|nr:hypothetical protein [Acidimicrobiia bacterium]